jgi:hypothetical protein
VKVLQLGVRKLLGYRGDRFWWWCEARDLRASERPSGRMQLHVLFRRPA